MKIDTIKTPFSEKKLNIKEYLDQIKEHQNLKENVTLYDVLKELGRKPSLYMKSVTFYYDTADAQGQDGYDISISVEEYDGNLEKTMRRNGYKSQDKVYDEVIGLIDHIFQNQRNKYIIWLHWYSGFDHHNHILFIDGTHY